MKKIFLPVLMMICGTSSLAMALTDIELSGEVDLAAQVHTLPTGVQGDSAFLVPAFLLNLNAPLNQGNLMVATFEGAEKRQDDNTQQFDVYTRMVYLDVVSIFNGMHGLRFGLIPQTWQEAQYEDWSYRFLGKSGKVLTEKYNYLSYSDLGVSFMSELPKSWGEWAFTLVNGEGMSEETGPHKEAGIFVRMAGMSPWTLSLNYVRGSYENMNSNFNTKERIQAQVLYHPSKNWFAGVELLDAHDPAEAVRDLKMADEVDVTDVLGQSVHGRGGSIFAEVGTGPLAKVMVRYDYLDAIVGQSGKQLSSALAALSYQVTDDIRSALAYDYTWYGDDFAPGIRDSSKIEFATQVMF
ncbi:hypothetical protein D3C87_240920 [compost metagenome]